MILLVKKRMDTPLACINWAVEGGITDAPYTYMQDLQNGTYKLPWEDKIIYKDGRDYGFGAPRKLK